MMCYNVGWYTIYIIISYNTFYTYAKSCQCNFLNTFNYMKINKKGIHIYNTDDRYATAQQ